MISRLKKPCRCGFAFALSFSSIICPHSPIPWATIDRKRPVIYPRGSRGNLRSVPGVSSSSAGLPPPLPRFGIKSSSEFAMMTRWISSSEELTCRCNITTCVCVCECPCSSHRYHVESKTWLLSTHAKSFKWHVRTNWNRQNKLKSAKSHSKTQKKRKLLGRYKFVCQLNTFQRKWSRNSLCFDHMNSSMKMQQTLSARFPSGGPRRCQNGLCQRLAVIACAMPIDGVEFRMVSACTGSKLSRE